METSEESSENGVSDVNNPEDPVAMGEMRKFLFDKIFDVEEPPEDEEETTDDEEEEAEPEVVVPTFSEEEMAAAREESFATGKAEGVNEATEATERQISASLEKLNQQFDSLFKAQEAADAAIMENAISVACGIARKVFPALNQQGALGEIERMTVMSLEKILEEPQVIIAVNPNLETALKERLDTLTAQAGYKGEVKIIADDKVDPGDCRMEWSGGGANRDMDALWREIDEIVERNLSGNSETSPETAEAAPEESPETSEAAPEESPETAEAAPEESPETAETAPEESPETSEAAPEESPETAGDDEVKADSSEVSGETPGEAPNEPLGETAPEQAADTDQEPGPGSSPGLPEETPETPGDEDTTTDQEDT